jgi:gas vesicle protein
MQYSNPGGARALTVGAIVGALVAGAAVGLLTAPESGAGTRRRLRRGLVDLSSPRLRDRWEDLSAGLERRRERRDHDALVERLEARIDALEEQLAQQAADEEEVEIEEEEESGGHSGSALGLAAGALLTWFLSSDKAAPARQRAKDVAGQARERASDEWARFKQKRGGYRRDGDRIVPEAPAGTAQ